MNAAQRRDRASMQRRDALRVRCRRNAARHRRAPYFARGVPLIVDGCLDQLNELASATLDLRASHRHVEDAYKFSETILRNVLIASGRKSLWIAGVSVQLAPRSEVRCAAHLAPVWACVKEHPDGSVDLIEVALEPALRYIKAPA